MSAASWCCTCFCVVVCVFTDRKVLVRAICHGAPKLDISTLFTTFFICTSLQFILCLCQDVVASRHLTHPLAFLVDAYLYLEYLGSRRRGRCWAVPGSLLQVLRWPLLWLLAPVLALGGLRRCGRPLGVCRWDGRILSGEGAPFSWWWASSWRPPDWPLSFMGLTKGTCRPMVRSKH